MTERQKTSFINRVKNELDPKHGFGVPEYNSIVNTLEFRGTSGNIEFALHGALSDELKEDVFKIYREVMLTD